MRQPSVAQSAQRIERLGQASLQGREFQSMAFISELRHPTAWYSKLLIAILALVFFGFLGTAAISGYLVYKAISPAQRNSQIDLQNFPGHPQSLPYAAPGESQREGWFFPGLKAAPTIMLCPAYESSRGELVTLASALQDQQYNVFLFDFSAQGSSKGRSTLGFREVSELRAAMNAVANRGDVDPNRFGLWGVNLGAYVALSEAIGDHRVRAVAVESAYSRPEDMVKVYVARSGLEKVKFITRVAQLEFRMLNSRYRAVPPLTARIGRLSGVAQLYLESPENPALGESTTEIFRSSPPPHELVVVSKGNYAGMLDDEKRNYENRIVSFFLVNLPATGAPGSVN
jgi:hypothetical protein